jgi:threonyl-tRNA synthetase
LSAQQMNSTEEADRLDRLRHSAAHIMAEAVSILFPQVELGIGPSIADGFYYDFGLPRPLTPEDLSAIEAKMREIVASNRPFIREEASKETAREVFASQPFKLELIDELDDDTAVIYRQGDFVDLCRCPHVASTGEVRAFKLLNVA